MFSCVFFWEVVLDTVGAGDGIWETWRVIEALMATRPVTSPGSRGMCNADTWGLYGKEENSCGGWVLSTKV